MKTITRAVVRLPIRLRLMLAFASVLIVLFGGLALALHQSFSASLDKGINSTLRTRASDLATLVRTDSDGEGPNFHAPLPESGGAFAQVLGQQGNILDSTREHRTESLLSPGEFRAALLKPLIVPRRNDARLLAEPLPTAPPTVLVVGESLDERDRALGTLSDLLFIGGPALLLLTCAAGYVLTGGALHPVERMRSRATEISGAGRDERLPLPEARDELRRLGETLNEMLDRLEDAITRERIFVAHAGHELRTPLSILKLELELAIADKPSGDELDSMLRSATEQVERLVRLAESLLLIARGERGEALRMDLQSVDVEPLMEAVVDRIRAPAASVGRTISLQKNGALAIEADSDRLEQALTNLVANALDHGDGEIIVFARRRAEAVELHVLDEGPGFAPEFLPLAFERFAQSEPDSTGGRRGSGLGLSIVEVIATAHGGSAGAANRAGGGADVWILLPRNGGGRVAGPEQPDAGVPG
jgi:two-component system OmpR family sensor kinase